MVGEGKGSYLIGKIHRTYTKVSALSKFLIQENKANENNSSKGRKLDLHVCHNAAFENPVWEVSGCVRKSSTCGARSPGF